MKTTILILIVLFAINCSKPVQEECWQAFDPMGYDVPGLIICGKDIAEVEAEYPQYYFYSSVEPKSCWKGLNSSGSQVYLRFVPLSMLEKIFPDTYQDFQKVDCSSFCTWTKIVEKHKSKITGEFGPTRLYVESFNADSCSKLFVGRIVVHRETTDSLITREFLERQL